MKLFLIIIIVFIMFTSCKRDPGQISTYYRLVNNTNYKINILMFRSGISPDSLILLASEFKEFSISSDRGSSETMPPPLGDSVKIVYNDTISIIHGSKIKEAKRNILKQENYSGGSINKYEYRYEYIFTNTDYEEALNLILSN